MGSGKTHKISAKDLASIESLAGYGLSITKIAHAIGISKSTMERWLKDPNPEFNAREAMDRGRAIAEAAVSQSCYEMAKSKSQPTMTMFWLNCRAGWHKTENIRLEGIEPQRVTTSKGNVTTYELKNKK